MRRYEVVFVLVPTLTDDEIHQTIEIFKSAAEEKGGKIVKVDEWGKRRLAYPIRKHTEGVYTILVLEEAAAEAVSELERRFKVMDSVIRFMSIRVDLDRKRADKFKKNRERKKQAREDRDRLGKRKEVVVVEE